MHKSIIFIALIIILFPITSLACVTGSLTPTPNSPFQISSFSGFIAFTVRPDQGDFLAVVPEGNFINTYANNNGDLLLSSSLATSERARSITYSPTGPFAAVTYPGNSSLEDNKLTIYQVSPINGSFTQLNNLTISSTLIPLGASFSYDGNYIAVTFATVPLNYFALAVYSFNQTTGALTQVALTSLSIPSSNSAIFHPNALFLALPTDPSEAPGVRVYDFDPLAATLTEIIGSPFATGQATPTQKVAYSPDGNFLAAVNLNLVTSAVGVIYSVDQITGALTLTGSTFPNGTQPRAIAYTSDGLFASVADQTGNGVYMYSVDQITGQFTLIPGSPFSGAQFPYQVSFSQDNTILATNNLLVSNATVSTFNVTTAPTVTITPSSQTTCEGTSVVFDSQIDLGMPPFTYAWSGPNGFTATTPSITLDSVQASDAGMYSLIVTDSSSCVSQPETAQLLINPLPVITITPASQTICGGTATFIASGVDSYYWTGPDGFTANTASINPTTSGIYTVTGLDTVTGCSNSTQASLINAEPIISIQANPEIICLGQSAQLSAIVNSGIPPYTYSWQENSEFISDQLTVLVTPPTTGIHTYTFTATSDNGCATNESATIQVNPIPSVAVSASATTINAGESVILTSIPTALAPYELHWSDGFMQSNLTGESSRIVTPLISTNYSVIIKDATGCQSDPIATVYITVHGSSIVSSLPQTIISKYCQRLQPA